jgi:hypothetical protein
MFFEPARDARWAVRILSDDWAARFALVHSQAAHPAGQLDSVRQQPGLTRGTGWSAQDRLLARRSMNPDRGSRISPTWDAL